MSEIKFKATRRLHDSGYRMLEKSGDMEYDLANTSNDVVYLTVAKPGTVRIDCMKDGTYRVFFDKDIMFIHNPELLEDKL